MNTHKSFSDIERDIRNFYEATVEVHATALKIAARALAVATETASPEDAGLLRGSRQIVWEMLQRVAEEPEGSLASAAGTASGFIVGAQAFTTAPRICERCGGEKPVGQSCGCFDNGGQ